MYGCAMPIKKMNPEEWAISIKALEAAQKIFPTQVAMGSSIGLKASTINELVKGRQQITVANAILLSKATGGKIKKSQLRPDFL